MNGLTQTFTFAVPHLDRIEQRQVGGLDLDVVDLRARHHQADGLYVEPRVDGLAHQGVEAALQYYARCGRKLDLHLAARTIMFTDTERSGVLIIGLAKLFNR